MLSSFNTNWYLRKLECCKTLIKAEKWPKKGDRIYCTYPIARVLSARVELSSTDMATRRKGIWIREIASHEII